MSLEVAEFVLFFWKSELTKEHFSMLPLPATITSKVIAFLVGDS